MLFFLDTNVLIDLAAAKRSAPFFSMALATHPLTRIVTGILAVTEFLAGAGKDEEKFLMKWIESGELEIRFFDSLESAWLAAKIRRDHRLKLADAVLLASALACEAHFLTGDTELLKVAKKIMRASSPF